MASGNVNSYSPLARYHRYRQQRVPYFLRPKDPHDWHWIVAGIGKTLIVVGLLMFAFVGYQLWGTGIQTAQAQNRLEDEFERKLAATTTTTNTTTTTTTTVATIDTTITPATTTVPGESTTTTPTTVPMAPPSAPTPNGDAIALLRIPAIGIEWQVVEGVRVADLQDGPGHFRETVMPGQLGNSAIAGHRTTYGEPFRDINKLQPGDLIEITTLVGTYTYAVTGSVIVKPSEYALVIPTIDPTIATLVLVTCDPIYTARNRLVVNATLLPEASSQVFAPPPTTLPPDPETTTPTEPTTVGETTTSLTAPLDSVPRAGDPIEENETEDVFSAGWFSDPDAIPHAIGWGVLLLAVGVGAFFTGRAARRLYVSFVVGFVPFLIVMYFFFQNVNRLLPPGL